MQYSREAVEVLLPTVWDEYSVWGVRQEYVPDPDMPKSASDPATSGSLLAHLADIQQAWDRAPLTVKERRAVFLAFGLDQTHVVIGRYESVDRSTISERLFFAVGKLTDQVNGTDFREKEKS